MKQQAPGNQEAVKTKPASEADSLLDSNGPSYTGRQAAASSALPPSGGGTVQMKSDVSAANVSSNGQGNAVSFGKVIQRVGEETDVAEVETEEEQHIHLRRYPNLAPMLGAPQAKDPGPEPGKLPMDRMNVLSDKMSSGSKGPDQQLAPAIRNTPGKLSPDRATGLQDKMNGGGQTAPDMGRSIRHTPDALPQSRVTALGQKMAPQAYPSPGKLPQSRMDAVTTQPQAPPQPVIGPPPTTPPPLVSVPSQGQLVAPTVAPQVPPPAPPPTPPPGTVYVLAKTTLRLSNPSNAAEPDTRTILSKKGASFSLGDMVQVDGTAVKGYNKLIGGGTGWINSSHISNPADMISGAAAASTKTNPYESASFLDAMKDSSASGAEGQDKVGNAIGDKDKDKTKHDTSGAAFGLVGGLFGMAGAIKTLAGDGDTATKLPAFFDMVQGGAQSVKGAAGVAKAAFDYAGKDGEKGEADSTVKIAGAVDSAVGSVKGIVMGVYKAYKLFKDDTGSAGEKAKQGLSSLTSFASAAKSAAEMAKNVYEILSATVPANLMTAIPALSIVVSALEMIMSLVDALEAGGNRQDMGAQALAGRTGLANEFGVDPEDKTNLFNPDKRGTFPAYKTFFRTKPEVKAAVEAAPAGVAAAPNKKQKVVENVDMTAAATPIKTKLKEKGDDPDPVKALEALKQQVLEYEYTDKMAEINMKRETGSWTNFAASIVNITADILTLSGVGALVGAGIKSGVAGTKVVHGVSKYVQKAYRSRGDGTLSNKSDQNKNREYSEHAKFIFTQVATLPSDPVADKAKYDKTLGQLAATGVSLTSLFANNSDPQKQFTMLVDAMKKR